MSATTAEKPSGVAPKKKRRLKFPTAITTLAIVTVLVWVAAIFIPSGQYQTDETGAPIPGSFEEVPSPLEGWDRIRELILSPVNGLYGIRTGPPVSSTPRTSAGCSARSVSSCSSWRSARSSP